MNFYRNIALITLIVVFLCIYVWHLNLILVSIVSFPVLLFTYYKRMPAADNKKKALAVTLLGVGVVVILFLVYRNLY